MPLPTLVVVPLSVLPNWERELSVWAPYLRVISLRGSAAARQLLLDHCWFVAPAAKGRASLQVRAKRRLVALIWSIDTHGHTHAAELSGDTVNWHQSNPQLAFDCGFDVCVYVCVDTYVHVCVFYWCYCVYGLWLHRTVSSSMCC